MDNTSQHSDPRAGRPESVTGERVVYVVPDDRSWRSDDDSIDLLGIWDILWQGKWLIIGVTALFAVASIAYALTLTHWYRSEVLLAPSEEKSINTGIAGQLGSLAGLAGISVGGGGNVEPLAVLRSRDLTRAFIEEEGLLTALFADKWDAANGRWLDEDPELWPDVNDAVQYFATNVRRISEDRETGLVTVAIEWTDPALAALWADSLVRRLNDFMRSRALKEAEANLGYLQSQLGSTSVVALQQAIGRLLEREHQKLMLARGNEEFAFRIIDSAEVPEIPFRPRRRLMVMVATAFGGLIAVFLVLSRHYVRNRRAGLSDIAASTT